MSSLSNIARDIFAQALASCSIERSFDRLMQTTIDNEGTPLVLNGEHVAMLDRLKRVRIVSIGKAGAAMLNALLARLTLPSSCDLQGALIAGDRP